MMNELEHLLSVQNEAGELPHWHAEKKALYWADIVDPLIYKYSPGTDQLQEFSVNIHVTGLGLRKNGGLTASKSGLYLADPKLSGIEFLIDPEIDKENVRFQTWMAWSTLRDVSGPGH